jgi:hypothetical protein
MYLLKSFMIKRPKAGMYRKQMTQDAPRFVPGQITIVDLTDHFIDATSACGIFEVIVRLFVRSKVDCGKVLVVDEAHKVSPAFFECELRLIVSAVSW